MDNDTDARKLEIATGKLIEAAKESGIPMGFVTLKWYSHEQRFHVRVRVDERLSEFWAPLGIYLSDPPEWIVQKITKSHDWQLFFQEVTRKEALVGD